MTIKENGGQEGLLPDPISQVVITPIRPLPPRDYTINLELFHIDHTRARHEDTDYVTLAAQVSNQPPQTQTLFVGDVNDGDHAVNMHVGPFSVGPNDTLTFNYIIMNKGHDNNDTATIKSWLEKGAIAGLSDLYPPGAPFFQFIGKYIADFLSSIINPDCDGQVAVDKISLTGSQLEQLTSATGSYGETRHYSYDSQPECWGSPEYKVTWHIPGVQAPLPAKS